MTRPADLDYIEELKTRIEALEAALRKIAELEYLTDEAMQKIAEDALDQKDAGIGCGKSVIEPWA